MLNFRKITLADRPWIQEALKQSDFMGCEYSFANNLAWCRAADSQICQYENFYLTCSFDTEDGAPHFSYPCGSGDLRKAILAMADFAAERQKPLVIFGLTSQTLPEIQALFPGVFTLENNRDDADYLYRTADFVALAGKKYHKKRNHIAQFSKYGAVFSEITPNDFDECITFAAESYNAKDGYSDASSVAEQYAIHTFFQNFEALAYRKGGHPFSRGISGNGAGVCGAFCHGLHLSEPGRGSGHSGTAQVQAVLLSGTAPGKMDGDLRYPGKAAVNPGKRHTSFVWCCPGTNLFYQIQKG